MAVAVCNKMKEGRAGSPENFWTQLNKFCCFKTGVQHITTSDQRRQEAIHFLLVISEEDKIIESDVTVSFSGMNN